MQHPYNCFFYTHLKYYKVMQMNKLTVTDFSKRNLGYGQWELFYTSAISGKVWSCHYTDSKYIDMIFNYEDENKPTIKFLSFMKKYIKTYGKKH